MYELCITTYLSPGLYPTANSTMCYQYFQNKTVLCNIFTYDYSLFGFVDGIGTSLGVEEYQQWLSNDLASYLEYINIVWNSTSVTNFTYQVYENPTSVLVYESFTLGCNVFIYCNCYCMTNYCNQNITTCSVGFNVNCNATNATIIASAACQNASLTTNATTISLSTNATTAATT
jgi:hypothetical protein